MKVCSMCGLGKSTEEFSRRTDSKDGANLIVEERIRQIIEEGWTADHDDQHVNAELARAALCYLVAGLPGFDPSMDKDEHVEGESIGGWPWEPSWWKPSDDPVRNLEKAGALIAAEIDRLQRQTSRQQLEAHERSSSKGYIR